MKKGVCRPPSSLFKTYASALNFLWGLIDPGLAKTWPLSTSSRLVPLNKTPTLSPASPRSRSFLNISTPVQTVFWVSLIPVISISSLTLITPLSTLPVTTVPLPDIEKTSSIGIRKSWSSGLVGWGIYSSTFAINSRIAFLPVSSFVPSIAANADPLTIGILSPSNSYFDNNSLTSISTKSKSSGSSTWSTLFMKTTIDGTPTCLASKICSLVWGIGPSAAETTSIAPSIWAAPVIIFFT